MKAKATKVAVKRVPKNKAEIVESIRSPYVTSEAASLQDRIKGYNEEFNAFKSDMAEKYQLVVDVEIQASPKGIMPAMVLIDLTKQPKQDGSQGQN